MKRLKHFDQSQEIVVTGARTHNLKGVDVDIPRDTLTVITGLSGSGKMVMAFGRQLKNLKI